MKKRTISSMAAAALVVSVVPAIVADAETVSTVKIDKVTPIDSTMVQVSYTTKAGKKMTSKVKTTKDIKHGATLVQFRLQGKNYTKKLAKAYVNKNYVSAMNNVTKAKDALNKAMDADAVKAINNAATFLSKVKTTEVNGVQYANLSQQVEQLQGMLADLTAPVVAADFDAVDVLKQSTEKMNAVKSMDSKISMKMKMSMDQEILIDMNMYGNMSTFATPIMAKMDMMMDFGEIGKASMQMYMEEANGKYITYTNVGDDEWLKEETNAISQDTIANTQTYLDGLTNVKAIGKQTLQGKELYIVEGTVSGDAMEQLIKESGALETTGVLPTDAAEQELVNALLKDLGDLKMKMWIDAKDYYTVKYEVDMSDLMSKMMASVAEELAGELTKGDLEALKSMKFEMAMSMVNSNFDAVKAFTIPAEVKNNATSAGAGSELLK